jgi:PAT family beta-lactamase induction signal transducer AmpG
MYAAGAVWNFFVLPRPAADVPAADVSSAERTRNIWRTLTILFAGVTLYFFVSASVELIGYGIFRQLHGNTYDAAIAIENADLKKAALAALPKPKVPAAWHMSPYDLKIQAGILGACVILLPVCIIAIRRLVGGTTMGEAFSSYARQNGFGAILSFIIFYRFGEAMIFAMAALFILDSRDAGGMGMTLAQLGLVKGLGQPLGLMLGGLLGGWWISRVGLRKAFWPLVICMHTPNLLYVWTAYAQPDPLWLYPVVFIEAFGYGVGFAGYFVFLMQVAQRGRFVTSHYAIGTGLGALFITFATIAAGIVQSVFGYTGVFIAACLMTIPGTLVLLFIPLDNEQSKSLAAEAKGGH